MLFAVKVSSDKQTLILKGEAIPPRRAVSGGAEAAGREISVQLQRAAMVLAPHDFAANEPLSPSRPVLLPPAAGAAAALSASARSLVPYSSSTRGPRAGAAEYVRTQDMSGDVRSPLIDIYA